MTDFPELRALLQSFYTLSEEETASMLAIWKPIKVKRKVQLTLQGETEKHLYFVQQGLQRVYYLDNQGREATLVFTYAPSFGGVIDSLLMQQPSRYFYETLTPSVLLQTHFDELNALMQRFPAIERLVRVGVTGVLAGTLERLVEIQSFSSEEKFLSLLKRSPHILQKVPHRYLANYLGIDSTNFSKLFNKHRI